MRSNTEPTATPKSSVAVLSKGVSEEPALSVLVKSKSPEAPGAIVKVEDENPACATPVKLNAPEPSVFITCPALPSILQVM